MIKTRASLKKKQHRLGAGTEERIKMTGTNIKRRLGHPGERTLSAEKLWKLISVQTESTNTALFPGSFSAYHVFYSPG